jgi:hypothetical protein
MAKSFALKYVVIILFLCISTQSNAQINSPISFSISYFGETITHPGLKFSFNYGLKHWAKDQNMESIYLSLSIGTFFHRRYQNSIFFIPEINFGKQYSNGSLVTTGIGFGYLHATVPNTYELNPISGEVKKVKANHNYLLSSYSFSFGKGVMFNKEHSSNVFIKPSFMYAFPNFPKGIGYLNLELGTTVNLDQNE